MEVHHVKIDRAKLADLPENEPVLLLLLAQASNELNVLTKLILMMRKTTRGRQLWITLKPDRHLFSCGC